MRVQVHRGRLAVLGGRLLRSRIMPQIARTNDQQNHGGQKCRLPGDLQHHGDDKKEQGPEAKETDDDIEVFPGTDLSWIRI
jgi:hypothetical protein